MQRTTRGRVIFTLDGHRIIYERVRVGNNSEPLPENPEQLQTDGDVETNDIRDISVEGELI